MLVICKGLTCALQSFLKGPAEFLSPAFEHIEPCGIVDI